MLKEELIRFATTNMGDTLCKSPATVRRGRSPPLRQTTQGPCSKSTEWGSANPRTRLEQERKSLDQAQDNLLNDAEKQRYQAITGSLMYVAQVTRYDILFSVNQLARATSKPSNAHMGAAKHVLRYLAGTINFDIAYKKGGFTLKAFSDI